MTHLNAQLITAGVRKFALNNLLAGFLAAASREDLDRSRVLLFAYNYVINETNYV